MHRSSVDFPHPLPPQSTTQRPRRDAAADLSEDGQLCLRILEFKFKIYHRKLFSYLLAVSNQQP